MSTHRSIMVALPLGLFVIGAVATAQQTPATATHPQDMHPPITRTSGMVREAVAPVVAWPSGWIVAEGNVLYPVVDDFGRRLAESREAFRTMNRTESSARLADAISFMDAAIPNLQNRTTIARKSLERAVRDLHNLGQRMGGTTLPTLIEVERVIVDAYRADLSYRVSVSVINGLAANADTAFGTAATEFRNGHKDVAVLNVRQASGYLRVRSMRTSGAGRTRLVGAVAKLDSLASKLARGEITEVTAMERVFDEVRAELRTVPAVR